ncbi:MAG: DUF5686 family protein [Paludibacter sp.]|nr:DUF5686 family protein [Paludibacter sp.]
MKILQNIFVLIFFLSGSYAVYAQETLIVGQVVDATDQTPIPDVNVYFKNTVIGMKTNEEGYFMLRTMGQETTVVFSCVGYKIKEIRVKPGKSVGTQVELHEENTLLQEVFVAPGVNPALEIMKRARILRKVNDVTQSDAYLSEGKIRQIVLLNKLNRHNAGRKIYEQLQTGNLNPSDSSLVVPLYMSESNVLVQKNTRKLQNENIFTSGEKSRNIIRQLLGDTDFKIDFYDNTISIYGKNIVSPLAGGSGLYYDFYLTDSVYNAGRKLYNIRFRTKNAKNLAFAGDMKIDSATYAIADISAILPAQANINFIRNLTINQQFKINESERWIPQSESITLSMNYELLGDSLHPKPEIFVCHSFIYDMDKIQIPAENFAGSGIRQQTLEEKLNTVNNTPLIKTAKWLADVILTGYVPAGKIDVGKIQQIARVNDVEGLRLTMPLRTNEHLWKNISVGGYVGYGFKSNELKYSGNLQFRIPGNRRRIVGASYTNDYRRIDYDYNNFEYRENALVSGDEDFTSSIVSVKSTWKLSNRKEWSGFVGNEWCNGFESRLYYRNNDFLSNTALPLIHGTNTYSSFGQQSVALANRISFHERYYDDHLQRIYMSGFNPVIYAIAEAGKYQLGNASGEYERLSASIRQNLRIGMANVRYLLEAGMLLGNVPYTLLSVPSGNETFGYSLYKYSLMNYMEYAADEYVNLHTDVTLNGLLLNQIPLIKHLNLRELASFKIAYGSLRDNHAEITDFPDYLSPLNKPYMEVGVGVTNIFRFLSLQSVWRLTDTNKTDVRKWAVKANISVNF